MQRASERARSRPRSRCDVAAGRLTRGRAGHDGARAFYRELFEAFPENAFALTDIVVGPHGVFEVATLDREASLFAGERIWLGRDFQRQALFAGSG